MREAASARRGCSQRDMIHLYLAGLRRGLARLTLVCSVAVLAGCSITEEKGQFPAVVRAERQLARAEKIRSNPPQKVAEILSVARTVAGEISQGPGDTGEEPPVRIYNRAAADLGSEVPKLAPNNGSLESLTIQDHRTGETYRLRVESTERGEYSSTYFQRLLDTRKLPVRRGEEAVVIPGLGGTLVGIHHSVTPGSPPPRFEPASGYRIPVTTIVDFGRSTAAAPVEARLRLIDPRQRDTVKIAGKRHPLAANFSAPLLSFGRLNELWLGFINMIRGENMRHASGLLLTEPYDPDRTPVIFVHGLLSSPFIWRRTVLALLKDPEIRRHYQFWAFSYPTGNPISFSALRLQEDLAFAQERFGLQHGVILIGHSMGGLLSRMQVTESGRTIWNEVFGQRAQVLYSQVPNDSRVKRALILHANPLVKCVIFVATPHRGSGLATGGIGAIAIWLIRLPFHLLSEIPEAVADALKLKGQRSIVPTSIQGLSPNSPLLHALDRLPIQAVHYSIIGDRGRGDTPNSSDGVVPYWSSHLASARSEKIVPSGHEAMDNPQAVEEIRRILLLNLDKRENRPSVASAR
jgi:pimeloyl-ACP methyl ester carboxylesterase